ncbi:MAG: DUF3465 domain-containing protein [Fluviicoccus sp.]|uniref:DUF3465 domain-containing protein n=1 Tax=Fluviicoccus sp. TaxID=2003552 RepID=UPI00271FD54F|nr:DUF3465 domain-containing protein [Fluviicoccus sp.]MDO8331376.1 DUF3465 domain-containing protein [Fluviicoccus sp.]
MKKLLILLAVLHAPQAICDTTKTSTVFRYTPPATASSKVTAVDAITRAFANHQSNIQVNGTGVVTKLLPDDNHGSRHQKFLIRLPSGLSLLIAHNIDLAARLSPLKPGDSVEFYGEYEWNPQGGVVHWTHPDPRGSHASGWLRIN